MASEWREVAIGELVEIFDGPHATPPKTSHGPVFLGISNLAQGRLDLANTEHLSEEDYVRWTRRVEPQAGDVVFSYETRLGEAAFIPPGLRFCLGRRMGLLRARTGKVDRRFLLYAYLGPQFQGTLRARTIHGSTVDRIPLIDMPRFPIEVPDSVDEQRAIAHILGTLDDKIELNRRMNETLEAMARVLFKSWFVDFDPVRAKAEGRDTGLPPHIADLFPDSFEDSELGEIPKGWEVVTIGLVADVIDCLHSRKPERRETGMPLMQLANIRDDGLMDMQDTYFIDEDDYQEWVSRMEASPGDCVITNVGRVGAVAQMPVGQRAALGRNMTGVRCKPSFPFPTVLIQSLLSQAMKDEIVLKTDTGTILDALNVRSIPRLRLVCPSRELLKEFEHRVRLLRAQMERHFRESRTLASLRNALLPMLTSGELRTRDAVLSEKETDE